MKNILVTGGAGYIGSHTCVELLQAGYQVTVIDNLSNSKERSLQIVCELTGKDLTFHKIDLLNRSALEIIFQQGKFDAVIHFAGLKAVGESVSMPINYYHNNLSGTLNLCRVMSKHQVKNLVFSSSATVYGASAEVPLHEEVPCAPTNPYGRTKWMIELLLKDLYQSDADWNIVLLRYFNPVGAHPSGRIGEDPQGIPNNLLPYIAQVAVGRRAELQVFGDDYPTHDGTGIRDYIHVVDLARGHIKAIEKLSTQPGVVTYNLGSNRGHSVLEMVAAFERACGKKIPYKIVARRPGDVALSYADASRANRELNWKTEFGIEAICADTWRWQSQNPNGFE